MAGPVAIVLTNFESEHVPGWRELMDPIADVWLDSDCCQIDNSIKFGGSYNGEGRPFIGGISEFDCARDGELSPEERSAILVATKSTFSHSVKLCAMCNDSIDHQLLCEIARFIASKYDDYVDFTRVVSDQPAPELLTVAWVEDGQECKTQLGRAVFCDWWLEQERFRMIK